MTNIIAFQRLLQGANEVMDCYVGASHVAHMWENLLTNPSFETPSGATTEVRRNLVTNPAASSSTNYSGAAGTGATVASSTETVTGPFGITTAHRRTWTVGATAGNPSVYYTQPTGATTQTPEGTVVSAEIWIYTSFAAVMTPRITFINEGSTTAISSTDGADVVVPANTWTKMEVNGAVSPAGATRVRVIAMRTGTNPLPGNGDFIQVTALLAAIAPTNPGFHSGSYSPDADLTPSWVGSTGASESILSGDVPQSYSANTGNVRFQSEKWASSGGYSMEVVPLGSNLTSTNTYAQWGSTGALNGFEPGATYTLMAKVRLEDALTGTLDPGAIALRFLHRITGESTYVVTSSDSADNEAGVTQLTLTFTVPANADAALIRFFHGGMGGAGSVWFDDALLVKGSYTGRYFDGDTPPAERRNLALDPLTGNVLTPLQEGAGAGVVTHSTTVKRRGPYSTRWSLSSGARGLSISSAIAGERSIDLFQDGDVYVVSFWVYAVNGIGSANPRFNVRNQAYGEGGITYLGQSGQNPGSHEITERNQWVNVWAVFRVSDPTIATGVRIYSSVSGSADYYVTELIVERSNSADEFFDGASAKNSHMVARWDGDPFESGSYLYDETESSGLPFWDGAAHASTSKLWGKP